MLRTSGPSSKSCTPAASHRPLTGWVSLSPIVSRRLARIEGELGVQLLVRTTRGTGASALRTNGMKQGEPAKAEILNLAQADLCDVFYPKSAKPSMADIGLCVGNVCLRLLSDRTAGSAQWQLLAERV
jgi:hypothetical protein